MLTEKEKQALKQILAFQVVNIANFRATLMKYEKKPNWYFMLFFWRQKKDVLSSMRMYLDYLNKEMDDLQLKILTDGKPASARSVEP